MNRIDRITNSYGKLIATIEKDGAGNKIVRDPYGKLLGKYEAGRNAVTDPYGKVIVNGDAPGILLKDLL